MSSNSGAFATIIASSVIDDPDANGVISATASVSTGGIAIGVSTQGTQTGSNTLSLPPINVNTGDFIAVFIACASSYPAVISDSIGNFFIAGASSGVNLQFYYTVSTATNATDSIMVTLNSNDTFTVSATTYINVGFVYQASGSTSVTDPAFNSIPSNHPGDWMIGAFSIFDAAGPSNQLSSFAGNVETNPYLAPVATLSLDTGPAINVGDSLTLGEAGSGGALTYFVYAELSPPQALGSGGIQTSVMAVIPPTLVYLTGPDGNESNWTALIPSQDANTYTVSWEALYGYLTLSFAAYIFPPGTYTYDYGFQTADYPETSVSLTLPSGDNYYIYGISNGDNVISSDITNIDTEPSIPADVYSQVGNTTSNSATGTATRGGWTIGGVGVTRTDSAFVAPLIQASTQDLSNSETYSGTFSYTVPTDNSFVVLMMAVGFDPLGATPTIGLSTFGVGAATASASLIIGQTVNNTGTVTAFAAVDNLFIPTETITIKLHSPDSIMVKTSNIA
jgi:hypothetical protein